MICVISITVISLRFILVCPTGSFYNSDNGGACDLCPVNTYGTSTNAASCTDCPSGRTTQQMTGQTSQNDCGE